MLHLADHVGRNGPGSRPRRLVAPVNRLLIGVFAIAGACLIGMRASAGDEISPLRWPQSVAGARAPAADTPANTAYRAQQPEDRQAGANQALRLPVLIPATGGRKRVADPPDHAQLDPPPRLEIAADSPALNGPRPVSELCIRAVGEGETCKVADSEDNEQPQGPGTPAAQSAASSRIAWPDMRAHAEMGPAVTGREPAITELSFRAGPPGALHADRAQCSPETSGLPARLRIVAADQPASAPELRLAWFGAPGKGSATGLSANGSASGDARPELTIRQAAHHWAGTGPSAHAAPQFAGDARLGPFRIIDPAHELTVWLRGTRRLLPDSEVVEAVPGDPNICQVLWDGPQEIVLTGRNVGSTLVTFRFRDQARPPYTCQVRVVADSEGGPLVQKRIGP